MSWNDQTRTLTFITDNETLYPQTAHANDAQHIIIQNPVKIISDLCFNEYTSLLSIEFPDSVEKLMNNVIVHSKIKTIHIPKNCYYMHEMGPFEHNYLLEEFTIDPDHKYFTVLQKVIYSKDMKTLINIPPNYQAKVFTVPFGIITMRNFSTDCFQMIQHLIIPQTVKKIISVLYRPISIKNMTIYRFMGDNASELVFEGENFQNSPIQMKDIQYVYSDLYANYFSVNKTAVIMPRSLYRQYAYTDTILMKDTTISTVIFPSSISFISTKSFRQDSGIIDFINMNNIHTD